MNRLILVTILITVVYSWDSLKRILVRSARGALKQNSDQLVGTALVLATLPANIVYLLLGQAPLLIKLALVLTQMLLVGFLIELVEAILDRAPARQHSTWTTLSSVVIGAVSPTFRVLTAFGNERRLLASFLKNLTIPILFGLVLKIISDKFGSDFLATHTDVLIQIVIGGLLITVTVEFLEKHFRLYRMHMFSYVRILLGIVIIFALGHFIV